MIEIPVHNAAGKKVDAVQIDEQVLGGKVRPSLLKQAYVRYHANRRQGSATTRSRARVTGSTRKLFKQKGTGNARRGNCKANILRGGGHAFAKRPTSWRQRLPIKMRRLANRNALLAKAVDGEIKLIDTLNFEKPSTRQFSDLLQALEIDRSCLLAIETTTGNEALSARNLQSVSLTHIDRLNAFDVLNHRYLLAPKMAFQDYLNRVSAHAKTRREAGNG